MKLPARGGRLFRLVRVLLFPVLLLSAAEVPADAGLGSGLKPDVRLLIDISGSMKESDPENLRAPALDLIVRLLPEGSRAGVWIFGEEVEQIVPHRVIDDAWRRQARRAVESVDNSGQRTNIPAALAAATYDLDHMDPSFRTSIVLLTDGKVDIAESPMVNARAARRLLTRLAPALGATGVPVHTVALSDEADWVFLRALASTTAGLAEKAESASELTSIFLQALEMVAPTARVPVAGSEFEIDASVGEFTALVFHDGAGEQVGLISPSGKQYAPGAAGEGVEWFANRQFVLVTVRNPEHGAWQIAAPGSAAVRVTVISDLQLDLDPLPNSLPAGRAAEFGLQLRDKGAVITDPRVLGLFDISVELLGPRQDKTLLDVSGQYPVPAAGEYRIAVPPFDEPGRYQVWVRISAETLQRELPMFVDVGATPARSTIVTRGEAPPDEDLKIPLITLGSVVLLATLSIAAILRRRRRRKLELWQRRSRGAPTGEDGELLQGFNADPGEVHRG